MSTWTTVLLASGLSFVLKFIGYLVPPKYLEGKKTSNVVALFPVALLTGLVCVQAFVGDHGKLVLDARAAVVALLLRAPFIVVVLVAAATAALIRLI